MIQLRQRGYESFKLGLTEGLSEAESVLSQTGLQAYDTYRHMILGPGKELHHLKDGLRCHAFQPSVKNREQT